MPCYEFIKRDGSKLFLDDLGTLEWSCAEGEEGVFPANVWCRVKSYHLQIWGELKLLSQSR